MPALAAINLTHFNPPMRKLCIALTILLSTLAKAGIHADFAVSQGSTPLGTFRVRLDYEKAPRTCANFIGLATGQRPWIDENTGEIRESVPFYDGLTFHRLIHSFIIQSGSPNGDGMDGPGYSIQDEYDATLRHSGRYILSMAKGSLQDSGGSQFFITLAATPGLDDKHSVFGEVVSGKDIIDDFTDPSDFPTDTSEAGIPPFTLGQLNRPITPIIINSVTIGGDDLAGFDLDDPAHRLPTIRAVSIKDIEADLPNDFFSVTYDRAFQTDYFSFESFDLSTWAPIARILSVGAVPDYDFGLSELDPARFFLRLSSVDYGAIYNFPPSALPGSSFTLADRSGKSVTLHIVGTTTSTWSDSDGGTGNISFLSITDSLGSSGQLFDPNGAAPKISQISIFANFDTPAGDRMWTAIDTKFSFHDPNSGWTDGAANRSGAPAEAVLRAFTFTPAP